MRIVNDDDDENENCPYGLCRPWGCYLCLTKIYGVMKVISKHFDNLKKAGAYQERLYNQYDHVKLIAFPTVWESGVYTWEVC